ncbi:MAG: nucleotidyltransferase domain-containing protein [Moraxella sp.]|nr:nucleotidyltransferase domain-containing protein [Moraxella sp.]
MTDVQLTDKELSMVQGILAVVIPSHQVFIFGSRAKGNAKPYSDLDLLIKSDDELDLMTLAELKDAFSQSDLPFKVDICEWAGLDDGFKRRISQELIQI